MDTNTHPIGSANINREALATLVAKAGPERVRALVRRFDGKNGVWNLDASLFFAPVTLTVTKGDVHLRIAGDRMHHIPLTLEDAKAWAAAWAIVMALGAGQDVDQALDCIALWPEVNTKPETQADIDFAPILADFPESFLDASGRPDIRLTVGGFPAQLTLKDDDVVFPAVNNGGEDVSMPLHALECIVKNVRWAQALMMRWNNSPSGKAWAPTQAQG